MEGGRVESCQGSNFTENYKILKALKKKVIIEKYTYDMTNAAHTIYNGPPDKEGIIQRARCLIK